MKKLLSLVAVLALVLTLAPVATVNAAADPVFYDETGAWQQIDGAWYFVVNYKLLNAPATGEVQLKYGTTVLATAAIGQPLAVSWADAKAALNYAETELSLYLSDTASTPVTIRFYKLTTDLPATIYSGDYVTFSMGLDLANGKKYATEGATLPYEVEYYVAAGLVGTTTNAFEETSSYTYTAAFEEFRFTGTASSTPAKLVVKSAGGTVLYTHEFTLKQTTLSFSPAEVGVSGTPTFAIDVVVTDRNGENIPTSTAVVTFNGATYVADIAEKTDGKSHLTVTVNTPTVAGTYTATVVTSVLSQDQVDGKGTFKVVYGKALVLGDTSFAINTDSIIPVFFANSSATIVELRVTVDDGGILAKPYYDIESTTATKVTKYVPGTYCPDQKVPVAEVYWKDFNSNAAGIKVKPVMGGEFTVTVRALMSDGFEYSQSRTYKVTGYKAVVSTAPESPVYNDTVTVTVKVFRTDGVAINNAKVVVGTSTVDGAVTDIIDGTYVVTLKKADVGEYDVKVYRQNVLYAYLKGAVVVDAKPDLTVELKTNQVTVGGDMTITGTVKGADGKLLTSGTVYNENDEEIATVSNGEFSFVASSANSIVGDNVIYVYDDAKRHVGSATYKVVMPVTVDWPTDGFVNGYAPDKIVAKIPETYSSLQHNYLTVESSKVTVVTTGTPTVKNTLDAVTFTPQPTVSGNVKTFSFTAISSYSCAAVSLKFHGYDVASFNLNNNIKMSIVKTATWYVGDTPAIQAKIVDAHGNPVKDITVEMAYGGVVTMTAKTDANGIADFGTLPLNLPGLVVMKANVNGLALEDKAIVFATRPEPVYTTKIVLTVGLDIYTLNGQIKFWDAAPYIKNGRTMVPLRALAEALGFQVGWDGETKTVSIWKPTQNPAVDTPYIMLQIGTTTAKVGSALYELDVAAEIMNSRTMVPLRFVAENLGYTVQWTPPSTVTLIKP